MKQKGFEGGWRLALYLAATLVLACGSAAAVLLNPWFSFSRNAMSDLGNPANTRLYWVFNYTLIVAGLLYTTYFAAVFRKVRPRTALLLLVASIFLVLVGVYHEGFGRIHFYVSVLYFVNGLAGLAAYWGERGSLYGITTFYVSLIVFAAHYTGAAAIGVSVPEVVASASFYLVPAVEIWRFRQRRK